MPEVRLQIEPEQYAKVVYAAAYHNVRQGEVWEVLIDELFYDRSAQDIAETVNVALFTKGGANDSKSNDTQ